MAKGIPLMFPSSVSGTLIVGNGRGMAKGIPLTFPTDKSHESVVFSLRLGLRCSERETSIVQPGRQRERDHD